MEKRLDSTLQELKTHGTPAFPFAYYPDSYSLLKDLYFYYHHHDEFEIVICMEGKMRFVIDGDSITLNEGDMILINSNILHQICHNDYPFSKIVTFVFSKLMLSLFPGSIIETKYLDSILVKDFTCMTFDHTNPIQKKVIDEFNILYPKKWNTPHYELVVFQVMLNILTDIINNIDDMNFIQVKIKNDYRIKQAIDFISKHYSEDITLKDIAKSISLSESECCKLFKRSIKTSPITYLTIYRINIAATLLRRNDLTITEVALQCGFTSSNYFAITFKKLMKKTPREYQKQFKTQ